MDHRKQYELADDMEFHKSHEAEMKLRTMARDAAMSSQHPVYFAASSPVMFHQHGVDPTLPPEGSRFHRLVVDIAAGIVDHDMRVLVAEHILRPQLRKAGWKV